MTCLPTERSTQSKSRSNYLRILRGPYEDFVLNEYSRSYLEKQQLPACHLSKLKFDSQVISEDEQEWNQYKREIRHYQPTGNQTGNRGCLARECNPRMGFHHLQLFEGDGAKQFAILVHALCWVHRSLSLRRLNGVTAQQRQEPIASAGYLVGLLP